jgi:hypothetical protein
MYLFDTFSAQNPLWRHDSSICSRSWRESASIFAPASHWSVGSSVPVFRVRTLKDPYDESMARTSFTLVLLAIAGAMALVLGVVGIYGVIAYAVTLALTRDRHPHGARSAAGRTPENVRAPRLAAGGRRR